MTLSFKHRWLIFVAIAISIFIVDVDMTAINLAVADIAHSLSMTLSSAQWIVDGFTIAAAAMMAFGGRCGDTFSRKKIFQYALILFALSSIAVGLSHGPWSIVISRVIQGACVGFIFPNGPIIARNIFPKEKQGFAIGLVISIAGISQALGPTFGGIIIHLLSWHWIFFINVPIAILAFLIIQIYLPEDVGSGDRDIELLPLLALSIGLFALITAFNEISRFGFGSIGFLGFIVLSIVSLGFFVYREFRSTAPLINLRLLLNQAFSAILAMRLMINFIYFGWLFLIGLLLQHALGYSALIAGFIMLVLTAMIAVFATPVGRLIDAKGSRSPIFWGLVLMLLANILLALMPMFHALWYVCICLAIAGLSTVLLIPATATASLSSVAAEKRGTAMGVLFTCGFLGSALGVAVLGSLAELPKNFFIGFAYCMIFNIILSLAMILLFYLLPKKL